MAANNQQDHQRKRGRLRRLLQIGSSEEPAASRSGEGETASGDERPQFERFLWEQPFWQRLHPELFPPEPRGSSRRPFTSSVRPPVFPASAPAPAPSPPTMEAQVDETVARIGRARPQDVFGANKRTIRDAIDKADLWAMEKSDMDAKVAALKESHREFREHAPEPKSRWSPDSTATSLSDAIDDIPSDEEPEICEARMAVRHSVRMIPAGSVKVVGTGAPALNKRQREEKVRAQAEKAVSGQDSSTSTLEKTIQRKLSFSNFRGDAQIPLKKKSTEPFPPYVDNFEEEVLKKNLGIPRDESYTSIQAWVDRHGDVKQRPESNAFDLDVLADRAIPPAPVPEAAYKTVRFSPKSPKTAPPIAPIEPRRTPPPPPIPIKSALRYSTFPSPTAVPLPTSPVPPFRRAPIRGKPSSPSTRSPLSQPAMTPPRFPALTRTPPRLQLPVAGPSASGPGVSPVRSSSSQRPTRQYCGKSGHVFRPIDLNAVQQNVPVASPYRQNPTSARQPIAVPTRCEKCGTAAEIFMQCEVPACKLSLCFDCAYEMQGEKLL